MERNKRDELLQKIFKIHSKDLIEVVLTVVGLGLDIEAYTALVTSAWDGCPITKEKFYPLEDEAKS